MTDRLKAFKTPEEREKFLEEVVKKVFVSFPDRS